MGISTVCLSLLVMLVASCNALVNNRNIAHNDLTKRATGTHFLFLFGDSYTRVEFNNKGKAPSAANPIGNPAFPGTTTSGGENWAVMLGSNYNTSVTLMYDYAFGGATINDTTIGTPNNVAVNDLNDQVNLFKLNMTMPRAPRWDEPHRSLFAVWFGQNDVYQTWYRSYNDAAQRFDSSLDGYFARMDDLYQLGARDFLWIGVSPIVRSPLVQASTKDNQTSIRDLSNGFNRRLAARAKSFAATHTGLTWQYYDPAPAFNRVLDSPATYYLTNSTCQDKDGVSCPWWNHFHPGVRIHEQVAADIAANATFPVLFTKSA